MFEHLVHPNVILIAFEHSFSLLANACSFILFKVILFSEFYVILIEILKAENATIRITISNLIFFIIVVFYL